MKKMSLLTIILAICLQKMVPIPFLGVNSTLGSMVRCAGQIVAFPASLDPVSIPPHIHMVRNQSKEWQEQKDWNRTHPYNSGAYQTNAQYTYTFSEPSLDPQTAMDNNISLLNKKDDEYTQEFKKQQHDQVVKRTLGVTIGTCAVLGWCKYKGIESILVQGVKYSITPVTLLGAYIFNNIITVGHKITSYQKYQDEKRIQERDKDEILRKLGIAIPHVDSSAVEAYEAHKSTLNNLRQKSENENNLLKAQIRQAHTAADANVVLKDAHQKFLQVAGDVTHQLSELNTLVNEMKGSVNQNAWETAAVKQSLNNFITQYNTVQQLKSNQRR